MNLLIVLLSILFYLTFGVFAGPDLNKIFHGNPVLFSNIREKICIGTLPPRKHIPIIDKIASENMRKILQSGKILTSPLILGNIEPFTVNFGNALKANIRLTNLVIEGLQDIQIRNLSMYMKGLRIDLDFAIPNLIVNVDYVVDATVLGIMRYRPRGHARLMSQNNLFSGSAGAQIIKINDSKHFHVVSFQGDVFITKALLQISGLNNDKSVVNKLLGIATSMHVNVVKETIINNALIEALEKVNRYLSRIPLKKLFSLIT